MRFAQLGREPIKGRSRRQMWHELARCLKGARLKRQPFFRRMGRGGGALPLEEINRRIAIDDVRKLVYFRIPKAANSAVIWLLWQGVSEEGCSGERETVEQEAINRAKRSFRRPSTLTEREVSQVLGQYWKFCFVRNPFTRTLSAYLHQYQKVEKNPRRYRRYRHHMQTFEDFCAFLASGGHAANPHWARQIDFVLVGVPQLDFVGKVERLDEDLETLGERLMPEQRPSLQASRDGVGQSHATGADQLLASYYDERTRRLVAETFADDFAAFGYDPTDLPAPS